jgi:hypothetical protein
MCAACIIDKIRGRGPVTIQNAVTLRDGHALCMNHAMVFANPLG